MPNYIKNKLIIKGTDEQIKKVKDFLKPKEPTQGENQEESIALDFNSITPMPKWVYQGDLGLKETQKYGEENCWYEWSIKNWGTKWNAFGTSEQGNIIEFETAWNGVPKLISKLGIIFPDIEFEYLFADENIGFNLGKIEFKDTEVTITNFQAGSKIAQEFALDLWGRIDEYKWSEKEQGYMPLDYFEE